MKTTYAILLVLGIMLSQSVFAHSKTFTPEFVDSLVAPYLQIQSKLAGDDLEHGKSAAADFLTALASAPDGVDAKATVDSLKQSTGRLKNAADINAARAAFLALSNEFKTLVEHVGTTGQVDIYVVTCSMAFGGKGGSWLQRDQLVMNPYYGSMMLHCGSVGERIVEKK